MTYDYEPNRLIRDSKGHLIEQDKATTDFKFADSAHAFQHLVEVVQNESPRVSGHLLEALQQAHHRHEEVRRFALWVIQQLKQDRQEKLTFGDFIRETGIFEKNS